MEKKSTSAQVPECSNDIVQDLNEVQVQESDNSEIEACSAGTERNEVAPAALVRNVAVQADEQRVLLIVIHTYKGKNRTSVPKEVTIISIFDNAVQH